MGERILGFQFTGSMPQPTDLLFIAANRYAVGTYFNAMCRTLEKHAGRDFSPEAKAPTVAFFREVRIVSEQFDGSMMGGAITAKNVFIQLTKDPKHRWFGYVPIINGEIPSGIAAVYSPVDEASGSQK